MRRSFGGRRLVRFGRRRGIRQLELTGLRHATRQLLLHRIAHHDPAALDARYGAFDQDQPTLDVSLPDAKIECGHAFDAEMSGHLLVLKGLPWILAAASRTMRAMRDGNAVAGAKPGKVPPFHRPRPAFTRGSTSDIDKLADHEMIGGDFCPDRDQRVLVHPEFGQLAFGHDLGNRKMTAISPCRALHLAQAGAELERDVAVFLFGAMPDDLAIGKPQHRDRHMFAGFGEQPRHSNFLCEHSGTHCLLRDPLQLDLDVDAGGQVELHQGVDGLRRRIDNIEEPFVGAHFELLAAFLVDMRRAVDGEFLYLGRQRNRPADLRASAFGGVYDLTRRRIENAMVESLEPDADVLAVHCLSLSAQSLPDPVRQFQLTRTAVPIGSRWPGRSPAMATR